MTIYNNERLPNVRKNCQRNFKIFPNTKQTLKYFQVLLNVFPQWINFVKSGHTDYTLDQVIFLNLSILCLQFVQVKSCHNGHLHYFQLSFDRIQNFELKFILFSIQPQRGFYLLCPYNKQKEVVFDSKLYLYNFKAWNTSLYGTSVTLIKKHFNSLIKLEELNYQSKWEC